MSTSDLTPTQITKRVIEFVKKIHAITAIVDGYDVKDERILSEIIETYYSYIHDVENKYYKNSVVMIMEFVKKQSSFLQKVLFTKVQEKQQLFWNSIEYTNIGLFSSSDKERYCVDYINGFGFENLEGWIKNQRAPYIRYALVVVNYILNVKNHFENIYEIMYIFNTPELIKHQTFVDIFTAFFVVLSTKVQLESYVEILRSCLDKNTMLFFSFYQRFVIEELFYVCQSRLQKFEERGDPFFKQNDLSLIFQRANDKLRLREEYKKGYNNDSYTRQATKPFRKSRSPSKSRTRSKSRDYSHVKPVENKYTPTPNIPNSVSQSVERTTEAQTKCSHQRSFAPKLTSDELKLFDEKFAKGTKELSPSCCASLSEDVMDTDFLEKHHLFISIFIPKNSNFDWIISQAVNIGKCQCDFDYSTRELMFEFFSHEDVIAFIKFLGQQSVRYKEF
ncbi:hypothetical protein EIN_222330 [Entamoeba invadens IP1]|uniref:Uncharacterized protein n=1 Tax=Entamoeba invadens IP1 TaxID=370355 RepID=A0A0A1U5H4_ENTIV|nr:hypothetical protein EIN_222330 [Entamoeba invadens IP1]ELP88090.1 hypothetical protein EIN_222330 [Entamoeba invadens IP1]|eukprot:XP_004254861.1 hypothetical protein EIN_222330 [Entamoeba invadens IP1]